MSDHQEFCWPLAENEKCEEEKLENIQVISFLYLESSCFCCFSPFGAGNIFLAVLSLKDKSSCLKTSLIGINSLNDNNKGRDEDKDCKVNNNNNKQKQHQNTNNKDTGNDSNNNNYNN